MSKNDPPRIWKIGPPLKNLTGPLKNLTGPTKNLTGPLKNLTGPTKNLAGPTKNLTGPHQNFGPAKKCQKLTTKFWQNWPPNFDKLDHHQNLTHGPTKIWQGHQKKCVVVWLQNLSHTLQDFGEFRRTEFCHLAVPKFEWYVFHMTNVTFFVDVVHQKMFGHSSIFWRFCQIWCT